MKTKGNMMSIAGILTVICFLGLIPAALLESMSLVIVCGCSTFLFTIILMVLSTR